jgi:p-hydroxybenzoate 3-monooxygenase
VDLLDQARVGERLHREGLVHRGIELCVDGRRRRIDFMDLTGRGVTVYGQTEITKDLNAAREQAGGEIHFEAEDVTVHDFDGERPRLRYVRDGREQTLACDFVAGCDGFHGICRQSVPKAALRTFERVYPFAWLGILADTPPVSDELVYVRHERGFALFSMRSKTRSRLYLQCAPDENLDEWPDARIWDELRLRLGGDAAASLQSGPSLDKSVTPMRAFVAEPMRLGRLFLAGDAAHIVPPTGAKGLNLAAADVRVLSRALIDFYATGRTGQLDAYSDRCLRRVWNTQRFSWWMTTLLHRFPDRTPFDQHLQLAELAYVTGSRAGATTLAENYVGLPFDDA